jgi:hypothetical protein
MTIAELVDTYFEALVDGDGDKAARVFVADGVIDDLRGGHHHGTEEIRRFIDNRPPLKADTSIKRRIEGDAACVYGYIYYGGGDVAPTRWLFTADQNGLRHLTNSRLASLEDRALDTH